MQSGGGETLGSDETQRIKSRGPSARKREALRGGLTRLEISSRTNYQKTAGATAGVGVEVMLSAGDGQTKGGKGSGPDDVQGLG